MFLFFLYIIFMKKLSLFGLVGLTGLLAFVATPLYAQEEDVILNDEEIVADVEDVVADVEDTVAADVEDVVADVEDVVADVEDTVADVEDAVAADVEDVVADVEDVVADVEEIMDVDEPVYLIDSSEESWNAVTSFDGDTKHLISAMLSWWMWMGLFWVLLAWLILLIIAGWKIFTKAWEGGWKILIPVYNMYILYKIVGMKNWFWYALLARVVLWIVAFLPESVAGIVWVISALFFIIVTIVAAYKLPRKFGWWVFTSILFVLFMSICILVLGFGNYKYEGKEDKTVVEA